jgi:hypothetical protein
MSTRYFFKPLSLGLFFLLSVDDLVAKRADHHLFPEHRCLSRYLPEVRQILPDHRFVFLHKQCRLLEAADDVFFPRIVNFLLQKHKQR